MFFKKFIQRFNISYKLNNWLSHNRFKHKKYNKIKINKYVSLKRTNVDFRGTNNNLILSNNCTIHNTTIRIYGKNNMFTLNSNVELNNCDITINGNNCRIIIGSNCTLTGPIKMFCGELNNSITVGENCLIGFNTLIMSSDAHPVFNETSERINNCSNVIIEDNVWICNNCSIYKGTTIQHGSIICADSKIHSKIISSQQMVAGDGTRILNKNITWKKDF